MEEERDQQNSFIFNQNEKETIQDASFSMEQGAFKRQKCLEDSREYYNLWAKKDSIIITNYMDDVFGITREDNLIESKKEISSSMHQIKKSRAIAKILSKSSRLINSSPKVLQNNLFQLKSIVQQIDNRDSSVNSYKKKGLLGICDYVAGSESNLRYQILKKKNLSQEEDNVQIQKNLEVDYEMKGVELNQIGQTIENIKNSIIKNEINLKKTLKNFSKINMVKKFVKNMTNISPQYNYRRLTSFHFQVIGDIIETIASQFIYAKDRVDKFVLQPNELFSLVWEVFQIVFLFFHVIAFGFRFGFNILLNDFVQIFSLTFFLLDLTVIMNTGYYQGIEIVTDRIKIIKHNAFNIFMIIISLGALVFSEKGPIQFVFLFRLKQLYRSYNHFEQNFQIKQKFPISTTLVRLFLVIILLAHYNACGFFFFTQNFSNGNTNWLSAIGLEAASWEVKYITALYFSFITMVTVGYGDIAPTTTNERIYLIFFVLISAIIFAYVVNTIGSLFQELSLQEGKFNQKKYEIMNYMDERKISKSIQISVAKFLEYTILQEKQLRYSLAGEKFLQSIPIKLRQQVNIHALIESYELFINLFSKGLSRVLRQNTPQYQALQHEFLKGILKVNICFNERKNSWTW